MDLANWQPLTDRGPDLICCLDFPGGRAAAGFEDLAAAIGVDACFLHLRDAGAGPLTAAAACWAGQLRATGRPVRAVLGYCAGTALATRLADALADAGPAPAVLLFDAVPTTSETLTSQFTMALEASARHLTPDELTGAQDLAGHLTATCSGDLPKIAAALAVRYGQLITAVTARLGVSDTFRAELTSTFTAYMDYLLLASQGGFDTRAATPVYLTSRGYQPPAGDARAITVDTDHDSLLRAPQAHALAAALLTGEHPW